MFTTKQLEPPTRKQLTYIKSLEIKSGLKFIGTTKREANIFIDKANETIKSNSIIKCKIERENEKFPFPKLADDLPTKKQWEYIESLEEKTMIKFTGVTRNDASEYINHVNYLIKCHTF